MSDLQSLGLKLREAREAHELSLIELEKRTRIRPRFLQAMETGQFQVIDNPLQLKGFLRSYAKAVGLDETTILNEYEAALAADSKQRRRRKPTPLPVQTPPAPNQPVIVTRAPASTQERQPDPALYRQERRPWPQLIVAIGLLLGVLGAIGGGAFLIIRDLSDDDRGTEGQILQQINVGNVENSDPTITPTQLSAPTQAQPLVINDGEPINVQITATQRLWARVTVDDVPVFEGILRPGEGTTYVASRLIIIKTTNAGGLEVLINNQPYILGTNRQAVERRIPDDLGRTSALPPLTASGGSNATEAAALPSQAVITTPTTPLFETASGSSNSAKFSTPAVQETSAVLPTASQTPTPEATSPNGVIATSTLIPTLGFSTNTATATPSPIPPTVTPTYTPSPFLPPRLTRTPTLDKS